MKRPLAALFVVVLAVAMLRPILSSSESTIEVAGARAYLQNSAATGSGGHSNKPDEPPGQAKKETATTPAVGTTVAPTTTAAPATTAPPIVTTTLPASTTVTTLPAPTTTAPAVTSTTAAPTSTTAAVIGAPAGAITIRPGQNIQQTVSGSPAGSTFYLTAGIHGGQQVAPRDGDIFIGAPGAVMNGNGSAGYAFRSGAKNVTIRGLVIEKYNNAAQNGAVQASGSGWVIERNDIRENSGAGISFNSGARIVGNKVHHNRQIGLLGRGSNVLIENNEIAYNNYLDQYEYGWEAGGTKFMSTTNLVVRGNWVHDNHGPGLWTDNNNVGTVYENNTVTNNYGPGIFHEISYQAVIRNNAVEGNAFPFYVGGILIANSKDVEVYGNVVRNNDGGIVGIEDNRGAGELGTYQLWNLWVHNNTVGYSSGFTGVRNNAGVPDLYTGRNIRFDANAYTISGAKPFVWNNADRTFVEWQSFGNDVHGFIQ